jgi:hypothetical protein
MKKTHKILVSVFDVNSFQVNTENLLVITKKNGLKVNVERNEYVFVSCNKKQNILAI